MSDSPASPLQRKRRVLDLSVHYPEHYWQRRARESQARWVGLISGIRGGKTVFGSMWTLEAATRGKKGVFLITGPDLPTLKQTTIWTITNGMGPGQLGKWPDGIIRRHHKTDHLIELIDGNVVLYRGGENPDDLRGPAAKGAWIDEVTLCKPDLLPIVQGRLLDTPDARGVVTGTPKGKNWFWSDVLSKCDENEPGRVWRNPQWEVFVFPTAENPGITTERLEELGKGYTQKMKAQELEGAFVSWAGALIPAEVIDRSMKLPAHWRKVPKDGSHPLVLGFDPAGKGRDWTAVVVVCAGCHCVVDAWRMQRGTFAQKYDVLGQMVQRWKPTWLVNDFTSMGGQAVGEELEARIAKWNTDYHSATSYEPFTFSAKSKYELLMHMAARLEDGIGIPLTEETQPLIRELRAYELEDKALETDMVMALALAAKVLQGGERRADIILADNVDEQPREVLNWRNVV